jgi:Protein of unknown function (DUF402)
LDPQTLPRITETKRSLLGKRSTFECRVVDRQPDRLVVLFVSDTARELHGIHLAAGTITFGTFWNTRPYNAYHFMKPGGDTLAWYFNVADETNIQDDTLDWRDLLVDVLWAPGAPVVVVDADELPTTIDPTLRRKIDVTAAFLVSEGAALCDELSRRDQGYFQSLFAGGTR